MYQRLWRIRYFIAFCLLLTGLAFVDQYRVHWLYYEREALLQGQWWRLWGGHLAHATHYHWLMNIASVVALYYFFTEQFDRHLSWMTLLILMPGVALGLYFFNPQMTVYTGFSGIAQAWLSFLLVRSFFELPKFNSLLLAMQWGRIIYEQSPSYDVEYARELINASVAVDAHLYGASLGVLCGLICLYLDRKARAKEGGFG